ncbi:hypothetical protein [Nostoc sp.]
MVNKWTQIFTVVSEAYSFKEAIPDLAIATLRERQGRTFRFALFALTVCN